MVLILALFLCFRKADSNSHSVLLLLQQAAKKTLGGCNICVPQHQQEADMGGNACLEQLIPLTRDSEGPLRETGAAAQPHPGQGSMQRITVDNNGKGESISNTVGEYHHGLKVWGLLGENSLK